MAAHFTEFFKKFPMEFSEHYVIKQIHKELECAEEVNEEHPDGDEHVKHMVKAYHMMCAYLDEKGINPAQHPY